MHKVSFRFELLISVALVIFVALSSYGQALTPLPEKEKRKDNTSQADPHPNQPEISKPNPKGSPAPHVGADVPRKPEEDAADKAKDRETDKSPDCLSYAWTFFVNRWNDIFLTLFTAVVAFFTYRLYKATAGLWDVAKTQSEDLKLSITIAQETAKAVKIQAQTMRDELDLKLRSKIHVRDVAIPGIENPLGRDEFPNGQLSIVNLGGVPANIVKIGAWFEIGREKGLPTEWPDESEKPNVPNPQPAKLEVGQSARYEFADERRPWSYYDSIRTKPNEDTLYVVGYVEYTDATQLPRYSRIFREYRVLKDQIGLHKISRRFFPVEGYEYEE